LARRCQQKKEYRSAVQNGSTKPTNSGRVGEGALDAFLETYEPRVPGTGLVRREMSVDWNTDHVAEEASMAAFIKYTPALLTIKGVNRNGRWTLFWRFRADGKQ
jgi:hypothetical protein